MIALVFGLMAASIFAYINVVSAKLHIDKHRNGTELNDRVYRGGEACSHTDDFITRTDGSFAQLGRVSVLKATRLAEEPELTVIRYLTP
jgi:hypothetical protein